jgi:hypothetical protein
LPRSGWVTNVTSLAHGMSLRTGSPSADRNTLIRRSGRRWRTRGTSSFV